MSGEYQGHKKLAKALVLLNLYDALFTVTWVLSGMATEANPLMKVLIETNVFLFVITKLILVNLGVWIVWQNLKHPLARLSICFSFGVYLCVCIFHTAVSVIHLLNCV